MIKRVYDGPGSTAMRERRYVVGTRKLDDARTVRLFRFFLPRRVPADAGWYGFIEAGIDLDGEGDDVDSRETEAVRASGVLDDLVEWQANVLNRRVSFNIRQENVRPALRRLISTPVPADLTSRQPATNT